MSGTAEAPATAGWRYLVRRPWTVPIAAIVLGTLVRIPQLFHSLNEMHAFRQTQTALLARNYADHGFTVLHSPLTVFGVTSDVPMDFPVVQGVASGLIRLGLSSDFAMRLIGLLSFQATAGLLVVLVLRWHGARVAAIAVVLLEFSPFGLAWGAASLIEFSAVALSLAMIIALDHWFGTGRWWWLVVAGLTAWLAFLVKATTAPEWCVLVLASAIAVIPHRGWRSSWRRILVGGIVAPGIGLGLAAIWTRYSDGIKSANPLTDFLTSSSLSDWNFGTLSQRVSLTNYLIIAGRVTGEMAGPLAITLALGVIAALLGKDAADRVRRLSWAVAAAFGPLVFFNLYVIHNYYLCAIVVGVVVVIALGLDRLAQLADGRAALPTIIAAAGVAAVLVTTGLSPLGRLDLRQWLIGNPPPPAAAELDTATTSNDRIVMVGCDWDPTLAYYSDRVVVMFRGQDSQGFWTRESPSDYRFLYSCAPSGDVDRYLAAGYTAVPTGLPGLSKIVSSAAGAN